jgi:hypothetical protein
MTYISGTIWRTHLDPDLRYGKIYNPLKQQTRSLRKRKERNNNGKTRYNGHKARNVLRESSKCRALCREDNAKHTKSWKRKNKEVETYQINNAMSLPAPIS